LEVQLSVLDVRAEVVGVPVQVVLQQRHNRSSSLAGQAAGQRQQIGELRTNGRFKNLKYCQVGGQTLRSHQRFCLPGKLKFILQNYELNMFNKGPTTPKPACESPTCLNLTCEKNVSNLINGKNDINTKLKIS